MTRRSRRRRACLSTATPLSGSINLNGARIDDVSLKAYRETTDPEEPEHRAAFALRRAAPLLCGDSAIVAPPAGLPLPGARHGLDSRRRQTDVETPVTLTCDNGHGLIFHRRSRSMTDYMFTVTDTIDNKTGAAVTLYPYSLVSRHGKPKTSGYSVLHEGMVGVVGDFGVQEPTYDLILKETEGDKELSGTGGWLGFTDKYWAHGRRSRPAQ